jgi:ABC-type branched-subunit amino acid transport system substrate-binding protein
MARSHRLLAGVALAVLAACSSAPAPASLSGDDASTGGLTAGGPTAPGSTGGPTAPVASTTGGAQVPGTTGSSAGGAAGATSGGGAGTTGRTGTTGAGTTGGYGGTGGAPVTGTRLFTAAEDRIGLTPTEIRLCAHAALTFGPAFNASPDDFNVFWSALNDAGGIFGRKVVETYEDDGYAADKAKTAAATCKDKGIFMLLGGIGFDQIPAVRNFAEQQRLLYLHHTATERGTRGQRYSFTALPTVERMGEAFAQLAATKYRGKPIGIIKRDSPNWEPGVDAFKKAARKYGLTIALEKKVSANQGNYRNEILDMKNAGIDVVWAWDNALDALNIVQQGKSQQYSPHWLLFPFNLTSQGLVGDQGLQPPMDGVAMFPAYSSGDTGGPFAAYADDIRQFEAQYKKYRPRTDLSGVAGDLLFLNWTAQKALAKFLELCGKDCSRNRFVDVLTTYKGRPTSSACTVDFSRFNGYRGVDQVNFMQTYRNAAGKVNWRHTKACVAP